MILLQEYKNGDDGNLAEFYPFFTMLLRQLLTGHPPYEMDVAQKTEFFCQYKNRLKFLVHH